MDAGERLFLEKGIAAASIDDIVRAANVAKGTFYLYFQSKDDLVAALRERYVETFQRRIADYEEAANPSDWSQRMQRFIEAVVETYLGSVELHDLLFHSADHHPERRASQSEEGIVRGLADRLKAGTEAGAWRVEDPEMTAILLYHAFHGALDHVAMTKKRKPSTKAVVATLRSFFSRVVQQT